MNDRNPSLKKRRIIFAAIAFFALHVLSLLTPGESLSHDGVRVAVSGWELYLASLKTLEFGIMIWVANPLAYASVTLTFLDRKRFAAAFALIAIVIAIRTTSAFPTSGFVVVEDSPCVWIWIASIVLSLMVPLASGMD